MNLKIKFREGFRPFAPSVLRERVQRLLRDGLRIPYMLLVAPVQQERRIADDGGAGAALGHRPAERAALRHPGDHARRLLGPGADGRRRDATRTTTHLIKRVRDARPGCGVIVNTSFNVRGEPIVCTPEDAYRCFMRTDMDYLVLGPFLLDKTRAARVEGDRQIGDRNSNSTEPRPRAASSASRSGRRSWCSPRSRGGGTM